MKATVIAVAVTLTALLWIKRSPRTRDYPRDGTHAPRTINDNRCRR